MQIENFGQLLQHLATKAGIPTDDKNLINALSNAELTKVPIHSDLAKGLDEALLSVTAAGDNHPVIGSKYKAQALNPIDRKLEAVIDSLEVDDSEKARLKGIRSTYERHEAVIEAVSKQKAAAGGDPDAQKAASGLKKQVDELATALQQAKTEKEQALSKVQAERMKDKIGFELFKILHPKKTIYDELDPAVKETSINALINKALQDNGAEFRYDESGRLVMAKADGSKFLSANHTEYSPTSFLDEILAKNKILVVSPGGQQQQQQQQQQQGGQQTVIDATKGQQFAGTNQSVADFNEQQIAVTTAAG